MSKGVRLLEPIERLLDPGPERMPSPNWDEWHVVPGSGFHGGTIVERSYDVDLPARNEGPYRQDVPK